MTQLLALVGLVATVTVIWLALGLPLFIDQALIVSQNPFPARAIVCITAGLSADNLPLEEGWQRIHTAVQLYRDGYAPTVVFSGGGTADVSEAEIYSAAAQWLGCPAEVIVLDPHSARTADHPANLLGLMPLGLTTSDPVDVVTSPLHSRRTALCFRKGGYTRFRIVTGWVSQKGRAGIPGLERSAIADYRPNGKRYDDVLNRLKWRGSYLLTALREATAIAWYKIRGQA